MYQRAYNTAVIDACVVKLLLYSYWTLLRVFVHSLRTKHACGILDHFVVQACNTTGAKSMSIRKFKRRLFPPLASLASYVLRHCWALGLKTHLFRLAFA